MGDRDATTTAEPTRYPARLDPKPTPGTVRVRGVTLTPQGWIATTYDLPPNVARKYVVHQRPPDAFWIVGPQIQRDMTDEVASR